MAGADSQKQFLSLIRDFASEKSLAERRLSDSRKRCAELRPQLEAANAELESAKRCKETTEQDLMGAKVELSHNEASVQAQEARICSLQDDISKIRSELGVLKDDEGCSRDHFITQMFDINKKLRKLQGAKSIFLHKEKQIDFSSYTDDRRELFNSQDHVSDIEDQLVQINDQTCKTGQEGDEQKIIHKEIQQELTNLKGKVVLLEAVAEETKELQGLARFSFMNLWFKDRSLFVPPSESQTAESEQAYASLGELLQIRYACPSCKFHNVVDSEENPSEGK